MRNIIVGVVSLIWLAPPASAINLTISAGNGVVGGSVQFAVNIYGIEAGGAPVNNAQLDILFDTAVFYIPSDARRACQISPRLAQHSHTETLPMVPVAPAGMQRLRLNVIDTVQPLGDITDGDFYFCSLDVRDDAPTGSTQLAGVRQNVGDTTGRILPTNVGSAVVMIAGSGTADALQPRGGVAVAPGGAPALDIPAVAPGVSARSDISGRGGSQAAEQVRSGGTTAGSGATPSQADAVMDGTPVSGAAGSHVGGRAAGESPRGDGLAARTGDTPTVASSPVASPAPDTPTIRSSAARTPTTDKIPTGAASSGKSSAATAVTPESGACSLTISQSSFGGLPLFAVAWVLMCLRSGGHKNQILNKRRIRK